MTAETRSAQCGEGTCKTHYATYKRRWIILAVFWLYAFVSAFQWYQYSVIANIIKRYYSISSSAVDWTAMVFNITFIPLAFLASHFLNKSGTRWPIITGSLFMTIGAFIKMVSVSQDLFWVTLLGQTVVSISQSFVMPVPSYLAAIWFSTGEVTIACSIAVIGTMTGIAAGFVIPPIIVENNENVAAIGEDLQVMFYYTAGASTTCFILAVIFLESRPPTPPSPEQALKLANNSESDQKLFSVLKNLFRNPCYVLLLTAFTINQGIANSVSALLNSVILPYFEDEQVFVGNIGLTILVVGMAGTLLCGVVLDKTQRYKEVAGTIFALSTLGMAAYTYSLSPKSEVFVYLATGFVGFFVGGYVSVAFSFSLEVTYPEPEGIAAGMLSIGAMAGSTVLTLVYGAMIRSVGDVWANNLFVLLLAIGTTLHFFMKFDHKRHEAHDNAQDIMREQGSS